MRKKIFVTLLASGAFVLPFIASAAPSAKMYFGPASSPVNGAFSIDAMIDPGQNAVSGVEMYVTFDPSKLRLDTITSGASAFPLELMVPKIDNARGTASLARAELGVSKRAISNVATLNFTALAPVTDTQIVFTQSTLASADDERGTALVALVPAKITINGAAPAQYAVSAVPGPSVAVVPTRENQGLPPVSATPATPATPGYKGTPATPATPATPPALGRTLSYGSKGADVLTLQKILNALGYTVTVSGPGSPGQETTFFGKATEKALQKFQAAQGIVSSGTPATTGYGLAGKLTRPKLIAVLLASGKSI